MSRRCNVCDESTPMYDVSFCSHCGTRFHARKRWPISASDSSPVSPTRPLVSISRPSDCCPYKKICAEYLSSLKWQEAYFDRVHNHCYCYKFYPTSLSDTYETSGSTYVVPRGWCRFGLQVDQVRAHVDNIWNEWIITFHGTSAIAALSIVAHRQFLAPGDRCIDGKRLTKHASRLNHNYIFTSPTIAYSSLEYYCSSEKFRSPSTRKLYDARVVLQCRQKSGTFKQQGETIGAAGRRLCPIIPNNEIEIFTTVRAAIVPYGLLIHLDDSSTST